MSNAEFPQKYGVPAPGAPKGKYPTTIAELVQGGLHVAPNEQELLLIPPQFREEGMEVNVLSTQKKYRLINNPDTEYTQFSDWKYIPDGNSYIQYDTELSEFIQQKIEEYMNENPYTLPTATSTRKGGIKIGNTIKMTENGEKLNVALGTTPLTLEGSMWLYIP